MAGGAWLTSLQALENSVWARDALGQEFLGVYLAVKRAEYRQFIAAGGYAEVGLWMSEGWALCQAEGWQHPLYWDDALEREFTLGGWRPLDPHAPVCHLSYFEADAYAMEKTNGHDLL